MADQIRTGDEYNLALLRLMAELGRVPTSDAVREFDRRFGDLIAPEDREPNPSGNLKWDWRVRWARQELVQAGLMGSGGRGIWTITDAGRQWLEDNPHATQLNLHRDTDDISPAPRRRASSGAPTGRRKRVDRIGVSLEMLEQTRKAMPTEEFRQLWGPFYDQLLAEERARATTSITQTELGRRAMKELDRVHSYLRGRHAEKPDARRICLWIEFCYALELHREAASLLTYVDESEVDPAIFEQVKRLAMASKAKLGW
jgi:hypothetical protein